MYTSYLLCISYVPDVIQPLNIDYFRKIEKTHSVISHSQFSTYEILSLSLLVKPPHNKL